MKDFFVSILIFLIALILCASVAVVVETAGLKIAVPLLTASPLVAIGSAVHYFKEQRAKKHRALVGNPDRERQSNPLVTFGTCAAMIVLVIVAVICVVTKEAEVKKAHFEARAQADAKAAKKEMEYRLRLPEILKSEAFVNTTQHTGVYSEAAVEKEYQRLLKVNGFDPNTLGVPKPPPAKSRFPQATHIGGRD